LYSLNIKDLKSKSVMTKQTRKVLLIIILVLFFASFAIENKIVMTFILIGLGIIGFVIETTKTTD